MGGRPPDGEGRQHQGGHHGAPQVDGARRHLGGDAAHGHELEGRSDRGAQRGGHADGVVAGGQRAGAQHHEGEAAHAHQEGEDDRHRVPVAEPHPVDGHVPERPGEAQHRGHAHVGALQGEDEQGPRQARRHPEQHEVRHVAALHPHERPRAAAAHDPRGERGERQAPARDGGGREIEVAHEDPHRAPHPVGGADGGEVAEPAGGGGAVHSGPEPNEQTLVRRATVPPVGAGRVIGFVAPLGGPEGVVARPMLEAARAGADGRAEIVAVDDGRDPDRAARAVADLAADARCVGVVGPKNSGSVRAAAPVAAAAGLALVLPCATNDGLTADGPGVVFRLCANDSATATAAVALVAGEGLEPLAVVADDTAYGRGLATAVRRAAAWAGLALVDTTDGAGAVFLAMGEVEQAERMRALRDAGCAATFVSAEGGPGAPLPGLAGDAAEGAWLLYPGVATDDGHVYAAEAHDAAHLLATAGADRGAVRRALAQQPFVGRTGPIAFDAKGERIGATVSRYRVLAGTAIACP